MTEETTAFANAMIFDGVSAELREGCVRVAAGTIAEVAEGPGPGDQGPRKQPWDSEEANSALPSSTHEG